MKKIISLVLFFMACSVFLCGTIAEASPFDQALQRWTKERRLEDGEGGNLTVSATYYSAEFIEAHVQNEAQKNLWTKAEEDDYRYNFLGALQLQDMIPVSIKFVNNGPSLHLGPFDIMVKLRIGGKTYTPVDYDKRLNFKFQGVKEGIVYFRRYDEKTGKDLLKGVKSVKLEFSSAVTQAYTGGTVYFVWDVANDDPDKLYQGKAAERFESDRLIKRLEKLRKDKTTLESQLKAVDDEITTIQTRLDELAKK